MSTYVFATASVSNFVRNGNVIGKTVTLYDHNGEFVTRRNFINLGEKDYEFILVGRVFSNWSGLGLFDPTYDHTDWDNGAEFYTVYDRFNDDDSDALINDFLTKLGIEA